VYEGAIKGDDIEGQWTHNGSAAGWWKLYLHRIKVPTVDISGLITLRGSFTANYRSVDPCGVCAPATVKGELEKDLRTRALDFKERHGETLLDLRSNLNRLGRSFSVS
jgi:hypothetical protein